MSLIGRMFAAAAPTEPARDPSDERWWSAMGVPTASGQSVTPDRAMRLTAALACVRVIAETVSTLPLHLYRRLDNGDKERITDHPLAELFADGPNEEQTTVEFLETQQAHLATRGNAYAEILPGPRGAIDQLRPLHPDLVRVERLSSGALRYNVRDGNGAVERRLMADEVWHVRALTLGSDGICGISPIEAAASAIGAALAADDYAGRFWQNDSRPGGVIEMEGKFKDAEDRDRWRAAWQRAQAGASRHSVAVLENGMSYKPLTIPPDQAQFLETQKYQDVDIARIFRVPPHMIGILDRATFSNIEQQSIDFVTHTIRPWLVRWERSIARHLLVGRASRDLFVEFVPDALLRGDTESRFRAYAIGRNWGWLSANDVRRMENRNSIGPRGDVYLEPRNMIEAGQPGEPAAESGNRRAETGDPAPQAADDDAGAGVLDFTRARGAG